MKKKIWVSVLSVAAIGAIPGALATDRYDKLEKQDMRQAIEFERQKEQAAARQARIERGRGGEQARSSRQSKSSADRAAQRPADRNAAKPAPAGEAKPNR